MPLTVQGHIGTLRPGQVVVCRVETGGTWGGLLLVRRGDGAESEVGVHSRIDTGVDGQPAPGKHHWLIDSAADPEFYVGDQAYLCFLYGDPVDGQPVQGVLAGSFTLDTEAP